MMQKLIDRMEQSDRHYGEALEELHGRLESLAHQAQAARRSGGWGNKDELEQVETHASGLADRLRDAGTAHRASPPPNSLSEIEQRIAAFAEQMSASSTPEPFAPSIDMGRRPEPPAPSPVAPPPLAAQPSPFPHEDEPRPAPSSPEPDLGASDFDQRFRDLSERLDLSLSEPPGARELETMREEVEDLSHDFQSALGHPGQDDALKSIDQRLDHLSRHFDRAEQQHDRMASIEGQLGQILDIMRGPGSPVEEAANKAARAVAHMVAGGSGETGTLDRLDAIQMELRSINERTKTMDERTVDTLEAMNDTLKTLAGKVGVTRQGAAGAAAAKPSEPFRAEMGPVPREFLDLPAPHGAPQMPSAPLHAERGDVDLSAPSKPARPEAERRPVEPGAPARRREAAGDEDFIASARRAAQAAARQAEEQQSSGFSLFRRASLSTPAPAAASSSAAMETDAQYDINEGKKPRRLLVFAAIFLLIISAALLYSRLKSKDDGSVATPTEQSAPPAKPAETAPGKQGRGAPAPRRNETGSMVGSAPAFAATTVLTRAPAALAQEPAPAKTPSSSERTALAVPGISVDVRPANDKPAASGLAALRAAAVAGDAASQYALATRFATGAEGERDLAQAAHWYEKAAAQGFAPAQFRLAALYESGQGVARDRGRAKAWYQRAAEQGNVNAMHNLAVLYAGDGGDNADYRSAVKWFQAAASHGLRDSQFNLGILYEAGLGVQSDLAQAYVWFSLAAARGDTEAGKRAERVKLQLADDALQQADAAIAAWTAEPLRDDANAQDAVSAGPSEADQTSAADGDTVRTAQALLQKLGYDVGTPDGLLGPRTEAAIKLFQERLGQPATGRLSDDLLVSLSARAS